MATPSYSYPVMGSGGAALQGVMSGLTGGLMEIEEAKRAKEQMTKFSTILADRGYTADAAIYRTMADAQRPNFFQAAITGKTTKRDTDGMAEHALTILQKERDNDVKLATQRDQGLALDVSLARQEITANNSRLATLRREFDKNADVLSNPGKYDPEVIDGKMKEQASLKAEIDQLEAETEATRARAQSAVRRSGKVTTSESAVAPNVDAPFLPTESGPNDPPAGSSPLLHPEENPQGIMESSVTEDTTVQAKRGLMGTISPYVPSVLADSIGKTPTKKAERVFDSPVEESQAALDTEIAAAKKLYTIPDDAEIPNRAALKSAIGKAKFRDSSVNPLAADTKEEALALAKEMEKNGMNASMRPSGDKILVSGSTKRTGTGSDKTGLVVRMNGATYFVEDGIVKITTQDGQTKEFKDENGQRISRLKLLDIISSYDKRNPDNPAVILGPAMTPRDVNSTSGNPVAPSGSSSYSPPISNAAQSYAPNVEAWKNSLKKPSG